MQKTLSRSTKKFIRLEKSRIRMQFSDAKKQHEAIKEMYIRVLNQPKTEAKELKKEETRFVVKKAKKTTKSK